MLKIRAGNELVWKNPDDAQLGLGQRSVELARLSLNQQRLLALLQRGVPEQEYLRQAEALSARSEAETLLRRLAPLLQATQSVDGKSDVTANGRGNFAGARLAEYFQEIVSLSLAGVGSPETVMARRASSAVYVQHLDRTGLLLLKGLAAAGVGEVITSDFSPVGTLDIGALGFEASVVSRLRVEIAQRLLDESALRLTAVRPDSLGDRQVDLVVLSGQQIVNPREIGRWQGLGVTHLAVIFDAVGVMLSPLIRSGKTACLVCLEQLRISRDPAWPAVASQLLGSKQRFDSAALSLTVSGLALREALHYLDFPDADPAEFRPGYRLSHEGELHQISWPRDRGCACAVS